VSRVVEPEALAAAAREEAVAFLAGSPPSHTMTAHRAALGACFRSEDHREGVASFLERRPARFSGR
jgi:enoyl-CoA hydratase